MTNTQKKRVFTSVRPARVAVLTNAADEDWQATCTRIIEFFSGAWGGANNIIVPTDGETIPEAFWRILAVFDPDYLYFYYKTGKDLKINHPDKYEEWLEAQFRSFASQADIADAAAIRQGIDEQLMEAHLIENLSQSLEDRLIRKLAPFHILDHAIEKGVVAGLRPDFPLTSVMNVLANIDQRRQLCIYEPGFDGTYILWLASVTGLATSELESDLRDTGSVPRISPRDYDPFELMIDGRADADFRATNNLATPFELANTNTGLYRSTQALAREQTFVVVVGETLSDFCLYYSLRGLTGRAVWIPESWLKSQKASNSERTLFDNFADRIKRLGRYSHSQNPRYVVTSHSHEDQTLLSLVDELDTSGYSRLQRIRDSVSVRPSLDKLLHYPLRLYERDNVHRPSAMSIEVGSQIDFFDTPRPKTFNRLDPYETRWIAEVDIQSHQLPRNPALGDWVVKSPIVSSNGARIGSAGICYFCPTSMFFGGDIDTTLIRPSLFLPDAFQVFDHLLQKEGYSANLSDKGFFARDSIEKFGSLASLGALLRTEGIRHVLLKFLDHVKPEKGIKDEGVVLNDKRRYLNLPSITKLVGSNSDSQKLIELLLPIGALYRGFVFKCRFCRNADWFGLDEISQSFSCKRCGRSQIISDKNYWYSSDEPGWYYKLDEIVYQFLRHHGYVTVLSLDHLRAKSQNSFLFTPDVELTNRDTNKAVIEMDILCIQDGKIILGEAKKEDNLGPTKRSQIEEIEKYSRVAKQIGADGLVFATLASSWSENTIRYIEKTLTANDLELTFLTRAQLLAQPPS